MGETVRIASRLYRGRTVSGLPVLSSGRRLCSMLSPLLRSTGRPRRSILNRSLAFNWSPLPQHIKPFSRAQLVAPAAAYQTVLSGSTGRPRRSISPFRNFPPESVRQSVFDAGRPWSVLADPLASDPVRMLPAVVY